MELDHIFHPSHKLTYQKSVKRNVEGVVCAACEDDISSEHYSCAECKFFLHKLCAQRPFELTHESHPLHPLRLLDKKPEYYTGDVDCDPCGKTIEGFIYHCEICGFDLDFICAFPDPLKLNHVGHQSHVLTYEKVVKKADKGVACAACLGEISLSEHYSCAKCKFFLHKSCAQRPLELTHELHPLHSLLLHGKSPYSKPADCDSCHKKLEGFVYDCEICDFDLDFICAFPDGLKLNHVCHPQHVLTHEKVVRKADKGVACAACLEEISAEHYSCRECKFFLHQLCAQRPRKLTHELHPLHPLRLLRKSPYSEPADCNSCEMKLEGFVYHCKICEFDLDFICAFVKPGNHVFHSQHVLTHEKLVKKADKGVACAACLQEISGPLADYYSCRKCNFFLHQLCSRRPVELASSLHPQHPLRLRLKDPYEPGTACCFSCQKAMKGFVYDCSICNKFCLDFKCSFPKPENRIQHFEELHDHPLVFQTRPAKFSCDLCSSTAGEGEKADQLYSCSVCDFYIHKSCAHTTLAQRYKGHPHPLSLVQGVPEDLQIYDGGFSCDVCHSTVSSEDLVSHCVRCRYFVHVRCMITDDTYLISSIKDGVDYLDDSFFKHLFMDDEFVLVRWPPRDISSELIQPFLVDKRGIVMDVQPKIRHFSHEKHDMILFEEQAVNNDNFFEEEDEEILCDACIHPITAPYYCCQECNYFLHLACANLPSYINHFSHPYELKLYCMESYRTFKCDRCQQDCNGLVYQCETCKFALDLTCAALPAVIMHETHEHPLFQTTAKDEALCYSCGKIEDNSKRIFKCQFCDVYLDYGCAMFSRHIRHRWDRHHPFVLRFPPHADHPDHFMCDMCEELIDPTRWLYSCFQCDVSFHTDCAPRYEKYPNIKYGGKVQISSHHHILQYLRKATLKNSCEKCEVELNPDDVFECDTCYDCFCYSCVRSELP